MEKGFAWQVGNKEDATIFLEGEINVSTVLDFKSGVMPIAQNSKKDITLDCRGLTYIDSLGLSVLVSLAKEMKSKNLNLRLENVSKNVLKLLQITYIDQFVFIKSS